MNGIAKRMMMVFAFASASGALVTNKSAATPVVNYTLSLDDDGFGNNGAAFTPGEFAVYADVSADNGGLFGWGVDLTGPITSIFTMVPAASYTMAGSQTKVAGFTTGVTEDTASAKVSGVMDLGAGTNLIPIYGFGQVGGDLSSRPPHPLGYTYHDISKNLSGPQYNGHLLLAVGTYSSPGHPAFEVGSIDTKANVFDDCSGLENVAADVITRTPIIIGGPLGGQADFASSAAIPCAAVPEPASVSLLLSALPALFLRTRRAKRG